MSILAVPALSSLPLPPLGWGAPDGLAALNEARPLLPLELPPATVVSALTTVVLRAGEYAVKVYPPGTDPLRLEQIRSALAGTRSAMIAGGPPVATSRGLVTLTPWVDSRRPVAWAETGTLLRAFHEEHAAADVPEMRPACRLPSQLVGLPEEAATVLLAARDELTRALAEVDSPLGVGPIHGDVSPGNVVSTPAGARLIDLDWVVRAPREYDLASAARRFRDGVISRRTYRDFCAAYGHDVQTWAGLGLVDRIADLGGVAFRLWDDRHHGRPLDWVADELKAWVTPL